MGPLKNIRHEKFAQGIASGKNATQAYIDAGFSKNGAGQSGDRLLKNAEITARINDLQQKTVNKLNFSREDYQRICLERFRSMDPHEPGCAKHGEMLAKSVGFNEPEKIELSGGLDIVIEIGGNPN
jgi:phage terminase small subunit